MVGSAAERREYLDRQYPVWKPQTIWGRFSANAGKFHDRVYITSDEGDFTYGDVACRAIEAAKGLVGLGVTRGMHVGIHLCNGIDFVVLTYALAILGGVSVLTNPKATPDMLAGFLEQTEAGFLLTQSTEAHDSVIYREMGIRVLYPEEVTCAAQKDNMRLSKSINQENRDFVGEIPFTVETDPMTTTCIIFTSGSTSRSKGVLLSHDMVLRSSFGTCRTRCMEDGRRILLPIPLFHAMGYIEGLLSVIHVGGSVVITSQRFDPARILTDLKKYHCNDFVCVSLIAMRMLEEQKKRRETFPDLHAGYWASACPDHIWEEAAEAFGIDDITTAYGMTECGSTTVMMRPEDPVSWLKKYHGKPKEAGAAGMEGEGGHLLRIEIRDQETGEVLPAGKEGVIYCKGPVVTRGYDHDQEATAAAIDADGWFCTKDVGVMNEDGYLRFLGRSDDVYKINGENVSPARIDSVIDTWPDVVETSTVGIPDDRYGFVGAAFVQLSCPPEERKEKDAALRRFCAENLLHYQLPRYFIYIGENDWIRTSNNKVIKARMKELAQKIVDGHPGQESIFLSTGGKKTDDQKSDGTGTG